MYQLILTILTLAVVHGQNSDAEYQACITDNGEQGECVIFYLCNNNTMNTDGTNVIDIRSFGPCRSYMYVCCQLPNKRPPSDPIMPANDKIREGCGWHNPNGLAFRITGDTQNEYAKFSEFPWMVAIFNFTGYAGGGSLIHRRVVLTAAHVANYKPLKVRAGEWDMQTTKEIYPYQERSIEHSEIHEDFNKGNLYYDIALLFLSNPMDLAPNVGIACLPPARMRVYAGTQCFVSGWGKNQFDDKEYQVILKKVEVPVVAQRTCQNQFRKTRLGRHFKLHKSFMCAGGEPDKDACVGDGGSPLVCPIPSEQDRYVQNGIVAWGIGCGDNNVPGAYVNVRIFRHWIDNKVAERGFESVAYSY